jgi:iduronate 2-sulfatase
MSGRRPDTTRVWNFVDHFREDGVGADWRSLPQYFKSHGYLTAGSGKLFHPMVPPDNDYPKAWSTEFPRPYYSPECMPDNTKFVCPHSTPPFGHRQTPDHPSGMFHCLTQDPPGDDPHTSDKNKRSTACAANTTVDEHRFEYQLEDQRIRDSCVEQLERAAAAVDTTAVVNTTTNSTSHSSTPQDYAGFFLGCGFHKPHVPWQYPHAFDAHFPSDLNDIPLADDVFAPRNMPAVAWHYPADVFGMSIKYNGTCNLTRSRNFRRAYYAAIAYTDDNIGRVVDKLDALGIADSTLVVVFGDHGWQLGEHDTWAKMTNFEVAVRTPLIIRAPWKQASVGRTTRVLAETVDLYRTMAELVGLPDPVADGEDVNGTSLAPVFDAPEADHSALKPAAFSQFSKPSRADPTAFWPQPLRNETEIMGYTVRVDEWRYTCWFGFDKARIVPDVEDIIARELYDHRGDPGELDWRGEHANVADDPAHADTVARLHQRVLDYIRLYPVVVAAPAAASSSRSHSHSHGEE